MPNTAQRGSLVLGIETATVLGGVALVALSGEIVGETSLRNPARHSERILPAIESLLAAVDAGVHELAAVAVSAGPGSFTGLRTGIASAKGLACALGIPLYGVPTLAALAANAAPGDGPVCAVLNARRGEVFRACFQVGPAGPVPSVPAAVVPERLFARELPPGCLVLGELPEGARASRPAALGLRIAPPHLNHPRAAAVAGLGLAAYLSGRPSELATLRPGYLRPPDAKAASRLR